MLSLVLLSFGLLVGFVVTAWAVGRAARAAGSTRGGLACALLTTAAAYLTNLILAILGNSPPAHPSLGDLIACAPQLAGQAFLAFIVFKIAFRLTLRQALAPLRIYCALVLLQVALAMILVEPFLESSMTPAESMAPTLRTTDHFIVNKLILPRRWDLVAYRQGPGVLYMLKRLVGLPGDRLRFEQGEIFINDRRADPPAPLADHILVSPLITDPDGPLYRDGETITLGENEYFFIGDIPERSADSRTYGPTPGSAIVGVIDLLYWPPSRFRLLR